MTETMAKNKVTETNKSLLKETRQNAKSRESLKFFNRPHTVATGAAVSEDDAPKPRLKRTLIDARTTLKAHSARAPAAKRISVQATAAERDR